VIVKDIGFVPEAEDYANLNAYTLEKADLKLALKSRPINSHKGSFGRVLIIAGSKGMAGAAYFSAKAAYRMGAGLVQLYTCEENRLILQTLLPEAILTTYSSEDFDGRIPEPVLHWGDCIVFGPGLGRESYVQTMLNSVIYEGKAPVVLDADGLRALADMKELRMDMLQHKILKDRIIVTPHLGEMIPLCGECNMHDLQKNKVLYARKFAMEWNCICVLKDARTVVASSDGMDAPYFINHLGNNGMATAGSGDVLTGIIATLAAQGYKPNQAAVLGVLIHAIAGDSAAEKLGERAVTASDIIDGLCFLKD
jgi:NAD(P)H-hydrate epimerase